MAIQTQGTLEVGDANNKITLDPSTKTLSFSGTAKLTKQTGWMDITPFEAGDDGTNGAVNTLVTGGQPHLYGRRFRGDANQVTNRYWRFHIPHDIAPNPTAAHFHLHWMHNTVSPTGNAIFTIYVNACKRDGVPITETSTTLTITPTAGNCYYSNMVDEIDISALTGVLTNLQVDAMFSMYVERNAANDNFGGDIFVRGADMHVQSDGKYTTAKDEGAGWTKVNV